MRCSYLLLFTFVAVAGATSLPEIAVRSGTVKSESIALKKLDHKHQYSLLYSLSSLRELPPDARVKVEVVQGSDVLAGKTLHAGDPDFYTQFRIRRDGGVVVRVSNERTTAKYTLQVNEWPLSDTVRTGPIHRWQDAMPVALGKTVFAAGDDANYIALPGSGRKAIVEDPNRTDWYRFEFRETSPKLVFFQIELTERDQIPVNVTVHRVKDGKLEEFFEGEDPVALPHEVQALPGNKFTPRLLKEAGTYYVAVRANHPEYKLRTRVYGPPPYKDPQVAVRTALDYILAAADSWHANTPRRGGILDRTESVHQETSLCVACHATHFPQRAQIYATRHGYPVVQRQQLQFLSERFYNNPRPFYGFEEQGAVWARMISAAANVLSRMSHLMSIFEDEVTGERRESFHKGVAEYLKLYYAGREKLPPDETNGNTPLVSAHEVAWYSWSVTKDPRMGDMIAAGEVKNTIDLCYQTLALADIDREKYKVQIQKNAERILSLQKPDGQWSARFEPNQPEAEFQTGHALWALQAAGIPATDPRVAKSIQFLLSRQRVFGGWMDPLQSFENFRTPFRETQMAVLALSAYFPKAGRANGWNSPRLERLSADPVRLLAELDEVWDAPSPNVLQEMILATRSNDAMIRQAATEALGRLGQLPDAKLLGDGSKLVQRTAAWATRQAHVRHPGMPVTDIEASLASADDRTRWGATRIFSAHFSELAKQSQLASSLERVAKADPSPVVRMDAIRGLWQFWFWSADTKAKSEIEDSLLASLGRNEHPWVNGALQTAIYNLADENIRYLYNNWVPLLARQEDRDRVIRGRLAVESRLADKFVTVLQSGPASQKRQLLTSLTELPLRRGDVYDLESDLSKPTLAYNRIGNDIEQITFFGDSAERFARALKPLLESEDAGMRTLASRAVLLVRDTRFGDVNRLAGNSGENVKIVKAKVETMPEAAEVARSLKPPPVTIAVADGGQKRPVKVKLDESYFRGYVQPILEKRGKDGYACVHCHATHTQFSGTYATALNVVDPSQPEKSLILMKPTSTAESEGVTGANSLAHGGGVRWAKDSPEYVTILEWIKGAKE
jgi:hypothetical protein